MSNKPVENDVRLMRRYLVARQVGNQDAMIAIRKYLDVTRDLKLIYPDELDPMNLDRYTRRNVPNERYLIKRFGAVIMVDHNNEAVFLNSKWANPYTLYVRLSSVIPELGEYGQTVWMPPELSDKYSDVAKQNHIAYQAHGFGPPPTQEEKRSLFDRLFRRNG